MSPTQILKKYRIYVLIALVAFFLLIYIRFDNTPPHWDAGRHYYNANKYWEYFRSILISKRGNGRLDAVVSFFRSYLYYPPFVYWVSLPFQAFFGRSYTAILASNLVWLVTLGTATNLWLRRLGFDLLSRFVGLCFLLGSPFIIGQSREFQVDLPLLAMLMVTFWSMERLIQKFNLQNTLVFSAVFCLGLLTKWSFALFILPGLFVYTLRFGYLWRKYKTMKLPEISIAIYGFVLSIFGICSMWYLPNIVRLKIDLLQNSQTAGILEGDPQGFTWESFMFYINVIVNQYLWLPWLVFFVCVLGYAGYLLLRNNDKSPRVFGRNKITFASILGVFNFVVMYIYLIKQSNKDTRYAIILYVSLILFLVISTQVISFYHRHKALYFIQICAGFLLILNLFNLTLPIGTQSITLYENSTFPVTVVGANAYTNTRVKYQDWAIYATLSKASSLKKLYLEKNDSCIVNGDWNSRPNVLVDFDPMPLHTNYGTVWGLSEQYGLQTGGPEACFVLVGRQLPLSGIDTKKYNDRYDLVSSEQDWQGFNIKLLRKRI